MKQKMSNQNKILQPGKNYKEIKEIKKKLHQEGYYNGKINTHYDKKLVECIKNFQETWGLAVDGIIGNSTRGAINHRKVINYKMTDLNGVNFYQLEDHEYVKSITQKNQIILHHTAGAPSAINTIDGWEHDKDSSGGAYRVATSFVISGEYNNYEQNLKEGDIYQAFDPKYWAWSLGSSANSELEHQNIGIEICNWGGLKYKNGKYVTYVGTEIPSSEVYDYGETFRGYRYFHRYSDQQLNAAKKLIEYLAKKFEIKIQDCFDWSWSDYHPEIRDQRSGIFTHTNVRKDKHDCFPQCELLDMLNSLNYPSTKD